MVFPSLSIHLIHPSCTRIKIYYGRNGNVFCDCVRTAHCAAVCVLLRLSSYHDCFRRRNIGILYPFIWFYSCVRRARGRYWGRQKAAQKLTHLRILCIHLTENSIPPKSNTTKRCAKIRRFERLGDTCLTLDTCCTYRMVQSRRKISCT